MQKHKFQKQNALGVLGQTRETLSKKTASILNSPQFETHPLSTLKTTASPIQPILQNSQIPDILPVFQSKQQTRGSSIVAATSRTQDPREVVSVLEMSFNEQTRRTDRAGEHALTATFNSGSYRSSVTSCEGKSRFVESRLQRKAEAYEIFKAIKETQDSLDLRKQQILKTLAFRPLKVGSPKKQTTPSFKLRRF